jgi:hypothetical protein
MDNQTRENWKRIKDVIKESGNNNNMYYKRSCEILRTGANSMEKVLKNERSSPLDF